MADDESSANFQRSLKRREFLRAAGLGAIVLGAAGLGFSRFVLAEGTEEEEGGGRERGEKKLEIKTACIQFSKDGEPVGEPFCAKQANDLRVVFSGKGTLQFIRNGKLRDPPFDAPGKGPRDRNRANGFRMAWRVSQPEPGPLGFPGGTAFLGSSFPLGAAWFSHRSLPPRRLPERIPVVTQDEGFKFMTSKRIKRVWWTRDNKKLRSKAFRIKIPRGANDLEFSFKES